MGLAVVTGASGHVGGNLVRELLAQKRKVRVVVRKERRALEGLDVEFVEADTRDYDSLVKAFKGADVVFHLAAVISIIGEMDGLVKETNVKGTANVVRACMECKVKRLVHCSSIHAIHYKPGSEKIDETCSYADTDKNLAYDCSKALGQQQVLDGVKKGLNAVIVNPTGIIGPNDFKRSRMGQVLLDLYNRKMPALVPGGFNWVDVRDVVNGLLLAEKRGRKGEYYLISGHYCSVKDLAVLVHEITGVPVPKIVIPLWLVKIAAPFGLWYAKTFNRMPLFTPESIEALNCNENISHEKATKELGYAPRPLKETIADTYKWFRSAGMIK